MDQEDRCDIKQVKEANRSVLKRLNEITQNGESAHCRCSDVLEQLKKDLTHLNDRVDKVHLHENTTGPKVSEFERRFAGIESQLDELHKSVKTILAIDSKPGDANSPHLDAGVGANGFAEPSELESEVTDSGNVNKNKNKRTKADARVSTFDVDVSDQEISHRVPSESHQLQHSGTKSTPNVLGSTEKINNPTKKGVHSKAGTNENDARDVASEPIESSSAGDASAAASVGQTPKESSPFKTSPKIFQPNFVVSSNRTQPSTQSTRTFPNVGRSSSSENNVIRQIEKSYLFGDERTWKSMAQTALNRALQTTRHLDVVISVLCLDISESMAAGDAWIQVKTFAKDFLAGLKESKARNPQLQHEYVAVATFGHTTELKVLLTMNYDDVEQQIDGISCGGPSPLYGGLMMALAGAMSSQNDIGPCVNGIRMFPKIIVLTDGRPTELMLNAGPDIADESKSDQTMAELADAAEELDGRAKSLFFIGVGNYEENFIATMSALSGPRRQYTYKDGRRLARRHYLASEMDSVGSSFLRPFGSRGPSEDKEDLQDVRDDYLRRIGHTRDTQESPFYQESSDQTLLRVGSRVRRGLDWRWGNQDNGGPGTVVGHSVPGQVVVTWDLNGQTNIYSYGADGYQVILVDEPRHLSHGETIAVGSTVKPGRDYKSHDLKSWNSGVVLRLDDSKALVRWDSGKRGNYSFGLGGKAEVEVCSSTAFRGTGYTLNGSSSGLTEMNVNISNSSSSSSKNNNNNN